MAERLQPKPITSLRQSYQASCLPAAIAMALGGLGLDLTEQALIDQYFPTARLTSVDPNSGVTEANALRGLVQIRRDMQLKDQLRIDVFDPYLTRFVKSSNELYIVKAGDRALSRYEKSFPKILKENFPQALRELVRNNEIDVYSGNSQQIWSGKSRSSHYWIPEKVRTGFYEELVEFIRKGHIIGLHSGMTQHVRALDGVVRLSYPRPWPATSTEHWEDSFRLIDPLGGIYPARADQLVRLDDLGLRGDMFDRFFRVSPQDEAPDLHPTGSLRLFHHLTQFLRGR